MHTYFVVSVFVGSGLAGNLASVLLLIKPMTSENMQRIAASLQTAQTAFVLLKERGAKSLVRENHFSIRWFSPTTEVAFCGHGAIAAAFILWQQALFCKRDIIHFNYPTGMVTLKRKHEGVSFNLLKKDSAQYTPSTALRHNFSKHTQPLEFLRSVNSVVIGYRTPKQVLQLQPDFSNLAGWPQDRTVLATAPSNTGYVLRCFAPQFGVPEDAATGSVQETLAPFWAKRLNKNQFTVRQLSKAGGEMQVSIHNNKAQITVFGKACLRTQNTLHCPNA